MMLGLDRIMNLASCKLKIQ